MAFVIVVFARRIMGWRVNSSMSTNFDLGALEQALFDRRPERADALIHHSGRGSQYVSILYTECPSTGGHRNQQVTSFNPVLGRTKMPYLAAQVMRFCDNTGFIRVASRGAKSWLASYE